MRWWTKASQPRRAGVKLLIPNSMVNLSCDTCKKPIDPMTDNYIAVPEIHIFYHGKAGRMTNLHLCGKSCLVAWAQKNSEPSSIIASINEKGPSL
jgi:hypothetical protein